MRQAAAFPRTDETERVGSLDFRRFARRFPARLRERRFWVVQALVLATTAVHYTLEATEAGADISSVHHIPVTLYLIAVVYAGIQYGHEGGLLTAAWAVALTVPSMTLWHQQSLMWLGELAQLLVTVGVGAVVSWRVELESVHRRRAEASSRRLGLLHDVSRAVSQTLALENVLDSTLTRVAEALESDRAWVSAWEGPETEPSLLAQVGEPIYLADSPGGDLPLWRSLSRQIQQTARPTALEPIALAVPLVAEGRVLGALGVASRTGRDYGPDDRELLAAMANQVAVAMDNARLYRDALQMQQALRQYAGQVTRVQEEERKRIARELHDDAIQNLVLLCRQLDLVLDSGRGGARSARETLTELRGLAESTLQGLRRFSRDLRPAILDDLGLIPAIEWLTSDLSSRTGMKASLEVCGDARRLGGEAELLLFRIAQEALRNAEKHSAAASVTVDAAFVDDHVTLSVADNGRGFRAKRLKNGVYSGHLGLLGMQERAKLLGASLDVSSSPGKGTKIEVVVPVSSSATGA